MKKIFCTAVLALLIVVANAQDTNSNITSPYKTNSHHFTMGVGYAYTIGDKHDSLFTNYVNNDSHKSKMHHGYNLKFDYDYNFHPYMAFGISFSMFNSFDSYYINDSIETSSSDDRWIFYVGPTFLAHTDLIKNHYTFFARTTIGYMNFRNAQRCNIPAPSTTGGMTMTEVSSTYKRATFGYGIDLGCSYLINEYFSIDASLNYMGGSVSKVKDAESSHDLEQDENLSRFGINIGVKIKL